MFRRSLFPLLAGLLLLASCADQPTRPDASGSAALAFSSRSIDLAGVLKFSKTPDLSRARRAEKFIRASEGGVVELHGFRVEIPAGALPADATITIDLPTTTPLADHVLAEFGPHGLQFTQPVRIVFPLEGVLLPSGPIEVARWENGAWTSLGGTLSADKKSISSTTPHFSEYSTRSKDVLAGG